MIRQRFPARDLYMHLLALFLFILVVAIGAAFGAINPVVVPIDFHTVQVQAPLGVALLVSLLVGWLFGGLVSWSSLSLRYRAMTRQTGRRAP